MIVADPQIISNERSYIPERLVDFIWLEITSKCNLVCGHCYAQSGPQHPVRGDMTLDDWKTIIKDGARLGCRALQFIGGEPTLHPDFRRMVDAAAAAGFDFVEVYTNATSMTEDLSRFLAERGVRMATSFYSADPATHDRVTGKRGSFDLTVRGIRHALKANIELRAGLIETRKNLGHAPRARTFLAELGVERVDFDRERGIGRGSTGCETNLYAELCGECSKGKLCVTADGGSYPCVFSRFAPLGDIRRVGLEQIMRSEPLASFKVELDGAKKDKKEQECVPECVPVYSCNPCDPMGGPPNCPPMDPCSPYIKCGPNGACPPTD